ncbi:MAG TPA: hypothetical protein VIR16_04525, partial [Candidatus Limnocylindrales bacterium]
MESSPGVRRASAVGLWRGEDWLLAGWVAIAAPLLTAAQGTTGELLPANRPLDGVLGLAAIAGAVICLGVRRPAHREASDSARHRRQPEDAIERSIGRQQLPGGALGGGQQRCRDR